MRYAFAVALLLSAWLPPSWAWTAEEEAKLLPSDGEYDDHFGMSVALRGDTALIGAPGGLLDDYESGYAYVFTRTAGVWAEEVKLQASDGSDYDWFGWSVALHGNTAIIGATGSNAAYVFTQASGAWTEQAKLQASDGTGDAWFGGSVALEDDIAIVGASGDEAAYVFTRAADVWTQQAKLVPSDGDDGDKFGHRVALDGDSVAIAAPFDNDNGAQSGSVYVFTRTAGVWTEQAKLLPADGEPGDEFGSGIALDGDTVVVGAREDDDNGPDSGSAYVFARAGNVWVEQAKLLASDGGILDLFGTRVCLAGDTLFITAPGDDNNGNFSGSVYAFNRTGSGWTEQATLLASDGAEFDLFGASIAFSGDTVVIGASGDDQNGEDSGSAYVFRLIPDEDVPATTVVGLALLLTAVLGTGFYFVLLCRPCPQIQR